MWHAPTQDKQKTSNSSIGLKWNTPQDIRLQENHPVNFSYVIQYRFYNNTKSQWQFGPVVPHVKFTMNQTATVDGLENESFYEFRVLPHAEVVEKGLKEDFEGKASDASVAMKTNCSGTYFFVLLHKHYHFLGCNAF